MSRFAAGLDSVTDPSDFNLSRLPQLSQFDALARCYICKELFRGPVVTSCNHTFCSQCIRQHLMAESKCPLCKSEVYESQLRRDIVFDELVDMYRSLRPRLLELLIGDEEVTETKITTNHQDQHLSDDSIEVVGELKKRHVDSSDDVEVIGETSQCPVCQRSMPADFISSKHLDMCLRGLGDQALPKPSAKRAKTSRGSISTFFQQSRTPPPTRATDSSREATNSPGSDDRAERFILQAAQHNVNDSKRLHKLDFSSTSTPRLKERLAQLKLPTSGTRNQLELRYNQYHVLYNANLDAIHPQDDRVLRHQLRQWEQSHSAFSTSNTTLFDSHNSSLSHRNITDKNFSATEWMRAYNDEFRELEQAARKSMKNQTTSPSTEGEQNSASNAVSETIAEPKSAALPDPPQ
ncbi:hypothetical protein DIURU_004165 [Diutina rugosa]|uniref:Postreplication repair E3 ubiquitin-protein ligase RAD18 n=1 Tax=Diutina rugosa TaxID=5481 RepID=A0A642UIL7_DIURU|nr:uncharacterized protein DIURU_004165 [Diutina rugosa]KAA8899682.1 hypothetical protein DIURU_004165 [Diutina rugosa]